MSPSFSFPAMLLTSPPIGADIAFAPKDAEASEDNPADSDNDGGDSESLFGDT